MKQTIILFALLLIAGMATVFGQSVGIGTNIPDPSSILELKSETQGFLPPRMTEDQREEIITKPAGLTIYNTTTKCLEFWNTTEWVSFCEATPPPPASVSLVCGTSAFSPTTFTQGTAYTGTFTLNYTAGNGGTYPAQNYTQNGLTFNLPAGSVNVGTGSVTFTVTGTPTTSGNNTFTFNLPGSSCGKSVNVAAPLVNTFTTKAPVYNGNSVIDTQGVGYYAEAIPAASTIVVEVDVQQLGVYNLTGSVNITTESPITNLAITSQTLTYSASGTFTALGNQNVTFTRTAVIPRWYGTKDITISGTGVSNTKVISPRIDIKTLPASSTSTSTVTYAGKIWMDRNLGAHRKAIQIDDPLAIGNFYQWGRNTDGHEIVVINGSNPTVIVGLNGTTTALAANDTPGHNKFILTSTTGVNSDWRSNKNDNRWITIPQGPCPNGYSVANKVNLYDDFVGDNKIGLMYERIAMPGTAVRNPLTGQVSRTPQVAYYWTNTLYSSGSSWGTWYLSSGSGAYANQSRAYGRSVRCIKN